MIPFGNHPLFRLALGWLCPPKIAFLKLTTTPGIRAQTYRLRVFQDIVLPLSCLRRAVNKSHTLFEVYPVLVYPSRVYRRSDADASYARAARKGKGAKQGAPSGLGGMLRIPAGEVRGRAPTDAARRGPAYDWGMFFDLGVYGVPRAIKEKKPFRTVMAMREMEAFTRRVGGFPFLYADTFMDREEFAETFDLTLYDACRAKYGAGGAFPHVYDKTAPEVDVWGALRAEKAAHALEQHGQGGGKDE